MKPKPHDTHPCAVAACRYFGRLGGRVTAMPMCSHPDIKASERMLRDAEKGKMK